MMSLTPHGWRMLAFVVVMHRQGMAWSYREAARHLGSRSPTLPHDLVTQLAERGYVRRRRGRVTPLPEALAAFPAMPMKFIPAPHRTRLG